MPKNYYVILGIPTSSTLDDIKTAYRRLAKEFHPDYYGDSKNPFLAIQEAYSVLSDPERRRRYDKSIDAVKIHAINSRKGRQRHDFRDDGAEPLIPEERYAEPLGDSTGGARRSPWSHPTSLFDHFFDTATENWNYQRSCRDHPVVNVALSPEQVLRGGHVRVNLPAQIRCPDCNGSGGLLYECWRCFGDGVLRGEIPLLLNYPAGMVDGHIVELPLERHGLPGKVLTVRFNIIES